MIEGGEGVNIPITLKLIKSFLLFSLPFTKLTQFIEKLVHHPITIYGVGRKGGKGCLKEDLLVMVYSEQIIRDNK